MSYKDESTTLIGSTILGDQVAGAELTSITFDTQRKLMNVFAIITDAIVDCDTGDAIFDVFNGATLIGAITIPDLAAIGARFSVVFAAGQPVGQILENTVRLLVDVNTRPTDAISVVMTFDLYAHTSH